MRALKTLVKLTLWLSLMTLITVGVLVPATWLYTASNLQNQLESENDVEIHLRQSIESERQSLMIGRPASARESVKWEKPDFSRLPKHLIAFYITATGCPDYFRSPREEGWPWMKRLAASLQNRILDGDGACELIFARNLSRRLNMKTDLQVAVAADRVHRFLAKDQLVAFDLHSMWFDHGVIGVETASLVVMQKPLTQLNLAELAELQLAIPPWGFWEDIKNCRNAAKLKEARDSLLSELATIGHISDEMARTASSQPVRCLAVRR
ncbi:MAG: transglycosylase domain-containing protein [Archangium sp.]|nr:transglycosylase domain-containing protein [Archangium sp.]MDP3152680.1 transglycosylase domain-containing protein [Archangium sp.]MDP3574816.1 transglycosylase domain-containing protein [Archangium sp.]